MSQKYGESSKRSTMRFLNKQRIIHFYVKPEKYDVYTKALEYMHFTSMRSFCIAALDKTIKNACKDGEIHLTEEELQVLSK